MKYTNERLDVLRQEGDLALDPIIVDLLDRGGLEEVNAALRTALTNENAAPDTLPPRLREFMKKHGKLAEGADRARMARASKFFVDHGLSIGTLLASSSLLECFAAKAGVKALHATERMGYSNAERRVGETAQFVLFVMAADGFEPTGAAIETLLKVRMMHAASRTLIQRLPYWSNAEFGVPINQEDLLATLCTFGYTPLVHLPKLGVKVSKQEAEDYLYHWGLLGRILGLREDMIPNSVDEAHALFELVKKRHWAPSAEGKELTGALLATLRSFLPGAGVLPGVLPGLCRHLMGDAVCDMLAVPESTWTVFFTRNQWMFRGLNLVQEKSLVINSVVNYLGGKLMSGEAYKLARGRAQYRVPTALRSAWRLPPAGCGPLAVKYAKTLAARLHDEAQSEDAIAHFVKLAVLVGAADGSVDAFEIETIADFLEALGSTSYDAPTLRALIEKAAKETNEQHIAQATAIGASLRLTTHRDTLIEFAITVAYTNSGLAPQEREVLEALGKGAALEPLRLEQLVMQVTKAIDPALMDA